MDTRKRIILLDNGSVRAASTVALRRLASAVAARLGEVVSPVSLMHSDKAATEELDGKEAITWARFLEEADLSAADEIRVIPLFFGPSAGWKRRAPAMAAEKRGSDFTQRIRFAKPLVDAGNPEDRGFSEMMARAASGILDTRAGADKPVVLLVDHGSPSREVTACRDWVGGQLSRLLENRCSEVIACSMERREGAAYSFCDPLLETVLEELAERGVRRVVLSLMFFSPGRHAGAGGDIAEILASSSFCRQGGRFAACPLVGELPELPELLATRYAEEWGSVGR